MDEFEVYKKLNEVLIENVNSFETILKCLDFQNKGIITKTREKIMYNDKYEFITPETQSGCVLSFGKFSKKGTNRAVS